MKYPMSLMSIRVQGTCHNLACEGWQPAHGSPLSQVFFKNLHLRHARNFLISLACFLCSGNSGPRRRPTRFSVSFFPFDVRRMTGLVAFAVGLLRGAEFLLAGGEEVEDGDVLLDGDILIGTGATTAAGLTISWL
jgi:hypothetical protein